MPKTKGANPKKNIINLLKEHYPREFTIQEVADNLHIDRDTASKYLLILVAEGKVDLIKQVVTTKFFRIKKDLPVTAQSLHNTIIDLLVMQESVPIKGGEFVFTKDEIEKMREIKRIIERKMRSPD